MTEKTPTEKEWDRAERRARRRPPSCSKCGDPTHRLSDCPKLRDPQFDHERLAIYVERYFVRRATTQWPTVREAARALRWSGERVESAVEGDPNGVLSLTYYNVAWTVPLGDKFVECI